MLTRLCTSLGETVLFSDIQMPDCKYNHAAWKKIKDEHGFTKGIMLVFGEKEDE